MLENHNRSKKLDLRWQEISSIAISSPLFDEKLSKKSIYLSDKWF